MKDTLMVSAEVGFELAHKMITFQRVHNELRKDYLAISETAIGINDNEQALKPLLRACIKELFSLIEADVYLYNQYNPYPEYDDRDGLIEKFKNTFKHHGRTFKRTDDVNRFSSTYIELLVRLRGKRDNFTHPKGHDSINVFKEDLVDVNAFYLAYTNHVNDLMANTSISFKLPTSLFLSS